MAFYQIHDDFGNAFSRAYAQARAYAEAEKERKRQEEINRTAGQAYLETLKTAADKNTAPYADLATQTGNQLATAQGNLSALSAPITTSPDGLADTRSVRAILKDPQGIEKLNAMQTPEMPVATTQLQSYNQALAPAMQAQVTQLQGQDNQAQQMLAAAKEKYGTAMFDRLAPIVASGKVPAQAMIGIIERQIAVAEKTAIKEATNNAVRILSDKNADPAQKQAVLAQLMIDNPQAARGLAEAFGLKQKDDSFTLSPGQTRFVNGKPVAALPEKPTKPSKPGNWKIEIDEDTGDQWYVSMDDPTQRRIKQRGEPFHKEIKTLKAQEDEELKVLQMTKPDETIKPNEYKAWAESVRGIQAKYKTLRDEITSRDPVAYGVNNLLKKGISQSMAYQWAVERFGKERADKFFAELK
jgi:hypothetical protein